jgi:hypothetical protein
MMFPWSTIAAEMLAADRIQFGNKMYLRDAKVGDRVVIYVHKSVGSIIMLANKTEISTEIAATILSQSSISTTLGWKGGEEHPNSSPYTDVMLTNIWKMDGFILAQVYGSHCKCEYAVNRTAPVSRTAVAAPARKIYVNECPCGLHPSQCDYHKP